MFIDRVDVDADLWDEAGVLSAEQIKGWETLIEHTRRVKQKRIERLEHHRREAIKRRLALRRVAHHSFHYPMLPLNPSTSPSSSSAVSSSLQQRRQVTVPPLKARMAPGHGTSLTGATPAMRSAHQQFHFPDTRGAHT